MLAEPIKCRKILQLQKPESKFIQLIDSFRHFTSAFDVSLAVFSVLGFVQLLCNMKEFVNELDKLYIRINISVLLNEGFHFGKETQGNYIYIGADPGLSERGGVVHYQ